MKSKVIKILLSSAVTLALVLYSASALDTADWEGFKGGVSLWFMAAAALAYMLTYPLRALRIYTMTKSPENGYLKTFVICCRHQFYGRVVPFKVGDLSLVYLLKKHTGTPVASGGAVLVMLRFFDGLIMLSFFLLSSFIAHVGVVKRELVAVLLALMAAGLLILPFILDFIISKTHGGIQNCAEMLKKISSKRALLIIWESLLLWIFVYLSMHFVVLAFGCRLSVFETVSASFFASLAAFLPVNGLGGFGTTEAGWTVGFMTLGIDRSTALISGIASNIMSFVLVCIFGLISFLLRRVLNVQNNNSKQQSV